MPLQTSLSKKDLILAKKTFAANKLKWESRNGLSVGGVTPTEAQYTAARTGGLPGRDSLNMSRSASTSNLDRPATASTMSMASSGMYSPMAKSFGGDKVDGQGSQLSPVSAKSGHLKKIDVQELGGRGLTSATGLRKTNLMVARDVLEKKGNDPRLKSDPESLFAELNRENYYLPKVTITRPDGATLMDIYNSKRADTWARILKAQIKEEEEMKVDFKVTKEQKNEAFNQLVRKDLAAIALRKGAHDNSDEILAAIQEASSKAADDVQKKRREDARVRQQTFIGYALHDIDVKAKKRAAELEREIEASTMTINKVKAAMALEEKQKADKKALEAQRLERLRQENEENLKRKDILRQRQWQEDKRIFQQAEEAARKEDERRALDLASKTRQASEGPAHAADREIKQLFAEKQKNMFDTLLNAGNLLNKQLMSSEECTFLGPSRLALDGVGSLFACFFGVLLAFHFIITNTPTHPAPPPPHPNPTQSNPTQPTPQ